MTTKEAAAKLKIEPKHLRAILRDLGKGSKGKTYDLTATDVAAVEKYLKEIPAEPAAPKKKSTSKKKSA
jgi:hypothetical protein